MKQAQHTLTVATPGQGLHEITRAVADWVVAQPIGAGLLTLFIRHTSASLVIQENADPKVLADLQRFFKQLAPEDTRLYAHDEEGPDDMPGHIRSALTAVSLNVPVRDGRMALGTWQGIYVFEHRRAPHRREVVLHLLGD